MDTDSPYWRITLQSIVMAKIGEWAAAHKSQPTDKVALRLAIAFAAKQGIPDADARAAAIAAIDDWKATRRAQNISPLRTIAQAYAPKLARDITYGVRVLLDIDYPGGTSPGRRNQVSVVVNASRASTLVDIMAAAMAAYDNKQINFPITSPPIGVAKDATIIQIVAGGFPQAQITV